ncbi:hypothetical protein ASPSYDRAFT_147039 [Aspergillus sydowii CBS 593.65]|uniref:Uncharacterized protein n=1 Tax=Aspergillus sydowii CBS 593.65 TaxID=1036612 RepID=A0A1L9TLV0_9EURO|nr:uncharacterized protein ASPSYDRAFT_147039 [Aspergillus sydowii CBS 593.65]OJJ60362.1 hypothetical protein ASPSYDRAFT_147039 [Aspergillus sydowii CBS 593.65]
MIISTQIPMFASLAALVPSILAAECSFTLSSTSTQNIVSGGDNTHTCYAQVDYGNGETESLTDACNQVHSNRCYSSKLPYTICVHTNSELSDGYIDYADQHKDFNEDGCEKYRDSDPFGAIHDTTCTFPC